MDPKSLVTARFEIEAQIHSGNLGKLFRAHDRELGKTVALRLLRLPANRARDLDRFEREMQQLAALHHHQLATCVAHGQMVSGEIFVATEWLAGEDLARRLARQPLRVAESLVLARQVARVLAWLHERDRVHGDLRPSKLFLRGGDLEQVVLLGLGMPRANLSSHTVSGTSGMIATLRYAAPELLREQEASRPALDIFALGCVLFECLTGAPPFAGEDAAAMLAQLLYAEAPRLRQVRPELPPALDALLARMLAKTTAERITDGGQLVEALEAITVLPEHVDLVPAVIPRPSVGGEEQHLVHLILAIPPVNEEPLDPAAPAGRTAAGAERQGELAREVEAHGATVKILADGSLLATLAAKDAARPMATATATDRAVQAVQLARRLGQLLPGWTLALATGKGAVSGERATGAAMRQAMRLLESDGPPPGPDMLWIDELTAELLDTRLHVRQVRPGVWRLAGERKGAEETRFLLGQPTPCVGREQELRLLATILSACEEESQARAALVLGPSGMGKSRLRREFVRRLAVEGRTLQVAVGRGDPMRSGTAYGLLGQAMLELCGIPEAGAATERQARLREWVGRRVSLKEARWVTEFLAEICGLPVVDDASPQLRAARQDHRLMSDGVTAALVEILRSECAVGPVLLVLEDLHWSDGATVRVVGELLRQLAEYPLLVLALARPEVKEQFPRFWAERPVQELWLAELSARASEQLVRAVLGDRATAEVVERIVRQAGGNALFLEELIRAVAAGEDELPETVLAMLQARFLRLEAGARRLLLAASVFGETFWRGGVLALLGLQEGPGAKEVDRVLERLVAAEAIVRQRESVFVGETQYAFPHVLVREAAYDLLAEEERRAGHRAAGEYLERMGERAPVVLAEHYRLAGEGARAAGFYAMAAAAALDGSDLAGAIRYAEQGEACGATGEVLGKLRATAAGAHIWNWNYVAALEQGRAALPFLRVGTAEWCRAVGAVFSVAGSLGHREMMMEHLHALAAARLEPGAEAMFVEQALLAVSQSTLLGLRKEMGLFLGRLDEVSPRLVETGEQRALAMVQLARVWYRLLAEADAWTYRVGAQEALSLFAQTGDRRYVASLQGQVGFAHALLGDIEVGQALLRSSVRRLEQLQEIFMLVGTQGMLALALAQSERPELLDEAEQLARAAIAATPVPNFFGALGHAALAEALLRRGALAQAEDAARQALAVRDMAAAIAPLAAALVSRILLAQRRGSEAREVAEEGLERLAQLGGRYFMDVKLLLAAAEVRHAAGDPEGARQALSQAVQQIERRAAQIPDATARERYRTAVRDHARVRALAGQWGQGITT
jgi:tetratricopeptide (TPR) repeat protein